MAYQRHKRFAAAVAAWLISDSDLVSLTGHTSGDLRLFRRRGDDDVLIPSLGFWIEFIIPFIPDADKTLYDTQLTMVAMSKDEDVTLDIMGALEELAAQDSSGNDTSFDGTNVVTDGLRWLGTDGRPATLLSEQGVYSAEGTLRVLWTETDT